MNTKVIALECDASAEVKVDKMIGVYSTVTTTDGVECDMASPLVLRKFHQKVIGTPSRYETKKRLANPIELFRKVITLIKDLFMVDETTYIEASSDYEVKENVKYSYVFDEVDGKPTFIKENQ